MIFNRVVFIWFNGFQYGFNNNEEKGGCEKVKNGGVWLGKWWVFNWTIAISKIEILEFNGKIIAFSRKIIV